MNWQQAGSPGAPGGGSDGWSTPSVRYDARAASAGFDSAGPGGQQEAVLVAPNQPPMGWLAVSLTLAVGALLLGLLGRSATTGLIGWLLAGPLSITAVALFTTADAKRRESGWYRPSDLAEWGRRVAIVVALVAVTVCAWFIANDVARGMWT